MARVDDFAPLEPELESEAAVDIAPERPEVESIHFRRFSDQELESVQVHLRRPSEPRLASVQEPDAQPELDPDSEQDLSPCLWQRLAEKFESRPELESESVQQSEVEPQTPIRAQVSKYGLKRLSLCMMPPNAMQDVLDVISPAPTPSPAVGVPGSAAQDTSLFLQ